jgi:hypothetical protein
MLQVTTVMLHWWHYDEHLLSDICGSRSQGGPMTKDGAGGEKHVGCQRWMWGGVRWRPQFHMGWSRGARRLPAPGDCCVVAATDNNCSSSYFLLLVRASVVWWEPEPGYALCIRWLLELPCNGWGPRGSRIWSLRRCSTVSIFYWQEHLQPLKPPKQRIGASRPAALPIIGIRSEEDIFSLALPGWT